MNTSLLGLGDVLSTREQERPQFNYEFLIFVALCGILAIFFLLYFNRLFGSLVSYAIRTWTWHQYRVYIDISAIQISLLGGRVFFTGLRYHGANETFMVQHGYITWRYWLRRVREADIINSRQPDSDAAGAEKPNNAELPCRIHVDLVGLEWFVYNRSPAYDGILRGLTEQIDKDSRCSGASEKDGTHLRSRGKRDSEDGAGGKGEGQRSDEKQAPGDRGVLTYRQSTTGFGSAEDDDEQANSGGDSELPFMLQLFPVHIDCHKAAVVMGNENTKGILVAKADSISVDVDASETKTPDPYRQTFKVQFKHPVIEMKDNEDFKEDQVSRANRDRTNTERQEPIPKRSLFRHHRRRALNSLRNLVPYWRRSVESFSTDSRGGINTASSQVPGVSQWQGLTRYLDDRDQDDRARWLSVEYAAVSTILDSPEATLIVYWDAVGKVTKKLHQRKDMGFPLNINGNEPPEWGMNFSIKGGTMNYGPWADRQRADLQKFFFPGLCKDVVPAQPLDRGSWRVATQFKLYVEMDDTVTMRVPIREESKNWRWRGKEPQMRHPKSATRRKQRNRAKKNSKGDATQLRPAGWLEVKLPANSTVKFTMDMLASSSGYTTLLDVSLPSSELYSSVNHDLLWRSGAQRLRCDLSNPISWNGLRNWYFNINSDKMELFILRDHVFLLIDLVNDWTNGPPPEYLVFTPFKYHINLNLDALKIYLNVNEANIIDKATVIEDNTYLILSTPRLTAELTIPVDTFRPSKNVIPFDVRTDLLDLHLQVPEWNTQAAFLQSRELAHVEGLVVDGGYHYNATTSAANTDTLILNVRGQSPYVYLYGFVVRYFILLKDNYFGDYVHFKTLGEYQEQLQLKQKNPQAENTNQPPHKKSNDMDVILGIKFDDLRIMLPTNLYSASRFIQAELASVSVDMRFTNYYMELEISVSPISLSLGSSEGALDSPGMSSSNTQLFIDGVRVYGHKLFGLPPTEPAYLCNYDIGVGAVSGECTSDFILALVRGARGLAFTFDDNENALVPYSSQVFYDITFARVNVESVRVWLHADEAAFLLSTDTIDINFNDWARSHYSKRINVDIPNIQVSCVNAESAARQKLRQHTPVDAEACLKTAVHLAVIGRKFHFSEERKLQQDLVQREDQRTHRTEFLMLPEYLDELMPQAIDPPAQCAPPPPHPAVTIEEDDEGMSYRTMSSRRSRGLSHKSSFLSIAGSDRNSVRIDRSPRRSRSRNDQDNHLDPRSVSMDNRPSLRTRGSQGSFGRVSAMSNTLWENMGHSSVAFSSQYVAPHFPLQGVHPSTHEVPPQNIGDGDVDDVFERTNAVLEDVNPNCISEEYPYMSLIIEFPSGVSAFANPTSIRYAATLLDALQPSEPEDLLDSFQISAMTDIFDLQKERGTQGKIRDIMVRMPKANFRLLNSAAPDSSDSARDEQDQYDVTISKVALITRTTTNWEDPFKAETWNSKTSLHLNLGSAEVSASERLSSLEKPQAAVMVQIDNVVVSVGAKDVRYIDADIGSIVGSTASGKVEYLASLIHRTGTVAAELGELLKETLARHQCRDKYFTYRLLEEGHAANDPSFLIRPSAVLRSAHEHVRTFDSWKLAMRLRQIWTSMDLHSRSQLIYQCWDGMPNLPDNAAQFVVEEFQGWRSWDLEDPSESLFLKQIFGQIGEPVNKPDDDMPLLGACRLGEIHFILDPGPKQNKVGFVDLAARIDQQEFDPSHHPGGFGNVDKPLTIVNLCCSETAINFNWELCELAEDIVNLYAKTRSQTKSVAKLHTIPKPKPSKRPLPPIHVVLEVTRGSVELETINLNARALSHGLKTSVLLYNGPNGSNSLNLMMNCSAITSTLHSNSHALGMSRLQEPSIFASYETQETDDMLHHAVKATASSKNLTFAVKEDPIGLMEVADLLFRDEVTQLYRLKSQIAPSPRPKPTGELRRMSDRLSTVRVNIAVLLDKYSISLPVLQSLTYKITGTVARAAAVANFGKEVIFDFDVKENYHEMQINVRNEPRSISLVQIPPTNGRITSHIGQTEHYVTVLSSLEVVQLDASAVYSLLTALNKPQINSAIQELQQQTKLIKGHISEIFGSEGIDIPRQVATAPVEPSLKLVYNVHLTLAGLQVFAKTSLKSEVEPKARVLFALDRAHLHASNRHEAEGPILKYPELHVNLSQISLDIERGRKDSMRSCGSLVVGVTVSASSTMGDDGRETWAFNFSSDDFDCKMAPETISTVVDVLGYMGEKIKDLDTSRELDYLRKLRQSKPKITINGDDELPDDADFIDSVLAAVKYNFELRNIRVCWIVADRIDEQCDSKEDLVLSLKLFQFGTRTRHSARLAIENFQLQMVPPGQDMSKRSLHSALLPEVIFNIAYFSTADARRMAFQAVGESLDLRLTSGFIVPAAHLLESLSLSTKNVQQASTQWNTTVSAPTKKSTETATKPTPPPQRSIFGNKRLENLLIDADFAGAVVYVSTKKPVDDASRNGRPSLAGKYGQFNTDDSGSGAVLRSPGLAWKIEYRDDGQDDPALYGEIKIDASSNILYPSVVPLVMDMMSSVKEVVKDDDEDEPANKHPETPKAKPAKSGDEDNILTADPSAVLGRLKLNLGLRICRQEFSLSCQPIARVAATTCFDNIYFTINTVRSVEQGNFFAISGVFTKLHASIQHVYSKESTASFELDSITLSFMNSKHFSGTSGVSAIINVSPMVVAINAKQAQDFLLFREIWYPSQRSGSVGPVPKLPSETSQGHLVQRYQQVAATAAFPWTATISIAALDVTIDMGQSIGKSAFAINNFWVSSKKTSDWEQNLCLGFDKIGVDCTGRLSGFVALQDFRLRSSIQWPKREEALNETPLIQASIGFNAFRVKAAFDYQAFLVADITTFEFLMYNVRESHEGSGDRLVAIFDGEAVQVFGTTTSAAQGIALWQAIKKLVQERKESFRGSLKEIEKFMKRKSMSSRTPMPQAIPPKLREEDTISKSPIVLDTDVVVTLKALNLGVFPSTFSDHQVFKVEALNAYTRFAASMEQRRIHSILKMTLGQLRVGLAGVRNVEAPKTLSEISVEDVVQRATGSRGGTILNVPQVSAVMETWQKPKANQIDYVFKSAFEGKVEVGWNFSRVSYIRGMFANYNKALEQIWGKELPLTAVKITGVPGAEAEQREGEQQKITAEVNVPQSKYDYVALEPPVIETPQLRDMGEATPPLEWIGLHRDRLPNLTHQVLIVSLLELAGEVEDAYSRILGSS
ncbi:hypothetical protein B0T10DRAFT_507394 [Thelonectria olida]|uniref:Fermentation associated protein n=1 Tax=Thelonectria olida TaxID=1576542 RepID=A0A9P9AW25_9HYPO|nr:hypothetical protein B0T10DRAFT_507394 [Thelonectria olida]